MLLTRVCQTSIGRSQTVPGSEALDCFNTIASTFWCLRLIRCCLQTESFRAYDDRPQRLDKLVKGCALPAKPSASNPAQIATCRTACSTLYPDLRSRLDLHRSPPSCRHNS